MKPLKALKWAVVILGALVVTAAATQCARPHHTISTADPSHTIRAQLAASNGLDSVLDRACGDCHSNTIASGWYTRVPPFSAVMARGASEGRKAVNFAEWSSYSADQQRAILLASCTDAKNGRMPMSAYLRVRPEAKLSAQDVETICSASR